MRLLRAVLPSWDVTKESSRMSEVVAKLFALLGRVLMTCHGSLPIQPPSGLFCVRLKSYLTLIPFSDPVGFGLVLIGGRYSQRSPCRHLALKMCKSRMTTRRRFSQCLVAQGVYLVLTVSPLLKSKGLYLQGQYGQTHKFMAKIRMFVPL